MSKIPVPLGSRVILVKEEAPETSEGGIVIPDKAREKPLTAKVIAVGADCSRVNLPTHPRRGIPKSEIRLQVGDEVVYASFAGTEFTINGQDIIVVDEEDIMLVLREESNDD
jgi:chaperonin GroES